MKRSVVILAVTALVGAALAVGYFNLPRETRLPSPRSKAIAAKPAQPGPLTPAEEARMDAICDAEERSEPPWASSAGAVTAEVDPECNAVALYYGAGRPRDVARARQCALSLVREDVGDPGLYGNGVLINIYANGEGVPRDLDMAIRYACRDGMASLNDTHHRVADLLELKTKARPGKPFDYCDGASSDYSVGQCTDVGILSRRAEEAAGYVRILAKLPAERRAAVTALRQASDAFAEARGELESTDGTFRFVEGRLFQSHAESATYHDLNEALAGRLPKGSPQAAAEADRTLNAVYRETMALSGDSLIPADRIRTTQRAWLKYRDAWLALARQAWPGSVDGFAKSLTEERTCQLRQLQDPTVGGC